MPKSTYYEPGFYWVRNKYGRWEVFYCSDNRWWFGCGSFNHYRQEELAEIGKKIECPSEITGFLV